MKNYNETWKDISGFEGMYQVSNFGRVRSLKFGKERILKPVLTGHGYLDVILCKDGKTKQMKIHRLVANAFLPNPDNLPVINHIDENKKNNLVDNLEWVTQQYNVEYSRAIKVGQYTLEGKLIKIWPSMNEAARQGFNVSNIWSCCKGRYKTHGGFIWKYIEN